VTSPFFNLPAQPRIAIVRFSALGDVTLVAAAVQQLHRCFPDAQLTWITSPLALSLLEGLPGVQFEVMDKPKSLADYRTFYSHFKDRQFDVVLALQANLRINLLYPALRAPVKIGFDRIRAREGQWLFCNHVIRFKNEHLLDSFLAFNQLLGCSPAPEIEWNLPISAEDHAWAQAAVAHLPRPLIAIHPCASKEERNWPVERFAEVLLAARERWQASFILTGGNSLLERSTAQQLAAQLPDYIVDFCGQTTPKQLTALLACADVLIAPDTAAVHLARAMNTPVIGLYAVAPPELSGPYQRNDYLVNCYPEALRAFKKIEPEQANWNVRVHHADAMRCITVEAVLLQLERVWGKLVTH
jgi:heptosyltransferase I